MGLLVAYGHVIWPLVLLVLTLGTYLAWWRKRRFESWSAVLIVAPAFWIALLRGVGFIALPAPTREPIDAFPTRLAIAAALPGRFSALEQIDELRTINDDDAIELRADLDRWRGACPARRFMQRGWIERARDEACDGDRATYDLQLGDFAAAASAPKPSLIALIAAGTWRAAAAHPDADECLALLMSHWAGDPIAKLAYSCPRYAAIARDDPPAAPTNDDERFQLQVHLQLAEYWLVADPAIWTDRRFAHVRETLLTGAIPRSTRADFPLVTPGCGSADALDRALEGDVAPLIATLRACNVLWSDSGASAIDAALVYLHDRPPALGRALRFFHDESTHDSPFALVIRYAAYRDLARDAGDPAEAARWQQLLDRFASMLSDRRRAHALAFALGLAH